MDSVNLDTSHFEISYEELGCMIAQLDQSLYNHRQWYNSLIRTLICQLPPDRHDMSAEAWKECRFGQWYYQDVFESLKHHPRFQALGDEHQRMHILARGLLEDLVNGTKISTYKYDDFANSLDRLRLEITSLKRELEDLLYNRDSLTGLYTRANILPFLREYHEKAKRGAHSFCLVMMDFDKFKEINDTHGHAAGDRLLSTAAHFVVKNLRTYDKVFRYGGEEFLICLQDIKLSHAFKLIDRIREELKQLKISVGGGKILQVSASFGLTLLDPHLTIENSISNADKALYACKQAGRDSTKIWEESVIEQS